MFRNRAREGENLEDALYIAGFESLLVPDLVCSTTCLVGCREAPCRHYHSRVVWLAPCLELAFNACQIVSVTNLSIAQKSMEKSTTLASEGTNIESFLHHRSEEILRGDQALR